MLARTYDSRLFLLYRNSFVKKGIETAMVKLAKHKNFAYKWKVFSIDKNCFTVVDSLLSTILNLQCLCTCKTHGRWRNTLNLPIKLEQITQKPARSGQTGLKARNIMLLRFFVFLVRFSMFLSKAFWARVAVDTLFSYHDIVRIYS